MSRDVRTFESGLEALRRGHFAMRYCQPTRHSPMSYMDGLQYTLGAQHASRMQVTCIGDMWYEMKVLFFSVRQVTLLPSAFAIGGPEAYRNFHHVAPNIRHVILRHTFGRGRIANAEALFAGSAQVIIPDMWWKQGEKRLHSSFDSKCRRKTGRLHQSRVCMNGKFYSLP